MSLLMSSVSMELLIYSEILFVLFYLQLQTLK